MKVKVIGQSGEVRTEFPKGNPWEYFLGELEDYGKNIFSDKRFGVDDVLILNSPSMFYLLYSKIARIKKERRILIIWEPEVISTRNFNKLFLRNFGRIYAASYLWAKSVEGIQIGWPQTKFKDKNEVFTDWKNRDPNKLVIIQGNKFSSHPSELYSLRRKVLNSKLIASEINLYGTNWNSGIIVDAITWFKSYIRQGKVVPSLKTLGGIGKKYSNYLGQCEDKFEVLRNYRFCIVIENSADFVSEKLFDAVSMGCLPLYVGPNLLEFGYHIPNQLVCRNDVEDLFSKISQLKKLSDNELESLAIETFELLKPFSEKMDSSKVLKLLGQDIAIFLNS